MVEYNESSESSAFVFHGTWRDYAPIAFTNLLLTIVTLGIYKFWATARTRRYLWSQSEFIDERLEWTGTGKELFFGFLWVLLLFGIPFLFIQFGAQALVLQGYVALAGALSLLAGLTIFYLAGVARFRAIRYRLGRTYWRGIRGGSNIGGWAYGISYVWKTWLGYFALGLLIPWSMTRLWNERWGAMSFGGFEFSSDARSSGLMKRFLLFYLVPIFAFILIFVVFLSLARSGAMPEPGAPPSSGPVFLAIAGLVFGIYILLGLVALGYFSKYFREVIGALSLGTLQFGFTASTRDWIKLLVGDVLLVVLTLGVGFIFLSYRHWRFFITHMEGYGEIDVDQLTQSTTARSLHGEGLLDAFDMGAI